MSKRKTRPKRISKTDRKTDPVTWYAEQVEEGKIIAGPHVRNACARHLRDLKDGAKRGLEWNLREANHAIGFFPTVLRLAGGQFEGLRFYLEPSQAFKTGSLFGWKRADGTRRFRRAYIEEGKGNGKSPWAAGVGLFGLLADDEPRSEVYAAAAKRDQAMVMFRDAVAMVEQSDSLNKRITKTGVNPVWSLAHLPSGSFFRPLSSDDSQSGPRPYFALCDELHEHKDPNTVEMLERGFKFRRQPLLIMITNSGTDRNSVCWQEHEYACRVAAGEVEDDATFSYVCALDKGDDPLTDPSCWRKANPLLGVTITEEYLDGVVKQARALPGKLNGILRLHFCVWTDAEEAWITRQALDAVIEDFDPAQYQGEPIHLGVDLSGSLDLTAVAYVVKTGEVEGVSEDGQPVVLPTFAAWLDAWTPRDTLAERALRDRAPYEVWVREGFLRAPPGKNIRHDFIAARLAEVAGDYQIEQVAYDRYAFSRLEDACDDIGLTLPFVEHPQGGRRRAKADTEDLRVARVNRDPTPLGLWMPGSLKELEALILEGRIKLQRNPVLMSACASAVTETDAFDNRWFSKRKATNRIDAVVALAMAVGSATNAVEQPASQLVFI